MEIKDKELPEHWIPIDLLHLPEAVKLLILRYAETYARKAIEEYAVRQEPVGWIREWEGGVSDWGSYHFVAHADERDSSEWAPVFTYPPNASGKIAELEAKIERFRKLAAAFDGFDLDGMCEAFSRLVEAHAYRTHPFHSPIDQNAQTALRVLRALLPTMNALREFNYD